jgi:PEP-CTERM motif
MNKASITLTAAAMMACAGAAQAAPTYTLGSFAIDAFTNFTGPVATQSQFVLTSTTVSTGSPTGSFTMVTLPSLMLGTGAANFGAPASLNFSDAGLGKFAATAAVSIASPANTATWDVVGTFTPGTDWANNGAVLTANEIWSLTQTGGPGNAISISATFHSPSVAIIPEPMTLALLGSGLAGLAVARRRKRKA